jgi:hypothetical protein
MTDSIEKRDQPPIVVKRDESEYAVDYTHRIDMTENALKAVVEPVRLTQRGQNTRSILAGVIILAAVIVAAVCFGRSMPKEIVSAAIWAAAAIGVTNGQALTKLVEAVAERLGKK